MSHLKTRPATISMRFAVNLPCISLMFSCVLLLSSGCAVVQLPSYRLEECAAESYGSPPIVLPAMPSIPVPGWFARWKAEKKLPKPPLAPRFHPLPTRPMFQAGPSPDFAGGTASYGTLPPAQAWNRVETIPAVQQPALARPL